MIYRIIHKVKNYSRKFPNVVSARNRIDLVSPKALVNTP